VTADSILLENDIAARQEALEVDRSFIVQAPAGSGKTELLIQRFLALLAAVDNPEEVLAITFTRKAAEEMRVRVIDALRRARDGVDVHTHHERRTLALAEAVLARDTRREWQLVASPGRMRIETVDAFGAGIARSLPLSSGLGGANATVADAEIDTIYREAAAATLDYLATDTKGAANVQRVLEHLDNNVGLYIAYLSRMLGSREQWLGITGSGIRTHADAAAARKQLEANIADVVQRHLASVLALLPPVALKELPLLLEYAGRNLVDEGKTGHRLASFAGDGGLPGTSADQRQRWHGIADLLLTQNGDWRKQVTIRDGFPPDNKALKAALTDIVDDMRKVHGMRSALESCRILPEPCYDDGQWEVLLALFELLPLAVAELRRLFGERGTTDHNEVAISAGRALGSADDPGEVALMLDYQVRHLLIDEMQDTSIAQYALLRKLTAGWTPGDGRTIFCVGDPMQSVYRFRDAEVGEFLVARERGIGSVQLEPLTLRQNFRSGGNLVHWFNTIFSQIMPLNDDIAIGAISYAESVPITEKDRQGECRVHALIDADAEQEAAATVDVIRQCLAQDDEGDVAVLVRSRTHLGALLPMLRRERIDYQAVEIERLTDVPEIIELIALTRALCHEGDRLAWLALLRSPLVGMQWMDIHALVRNDNRLTLFELESDPERTVALTEDGRRRLDEFLERIGPYRRVNRVRSLRERVELAWHALGGPALLADDEQLENAYRYLAAIDRISVAGTLVDVRELERRLDDERVSSTVSGGCRLQIMTMHKAKGLQFDHVVLPSLGRGTRGSTRDVLSWLTLPDAEGSNEMVISPVGPRAMLANDPLHRFIEATETDKNRMELDRLLYVACTRAKKSLHLVGSVGVVKGGEALKRPDVRSLLSRLWPAVEREYERAFGEFAGPGDERKDGRKLFYDSVLQRISPGWEVPMAAPVPGHVHDMTPADEDLDVSYDWVDAATRHAGSIIHRWLQRIVDGRVDIDNCDLADLKPISRRWAIEFGVPQNELDIVCKRTEDALRNMLEDDKGRWILDGGGHAELALTGQFDGRVESIVIDRIRIDDDGTHWVIDYKTGSREGGDVAEFIDQEVKRHRPQLARYAAIYKALVDAPVKTALYFPLHRQFAVVNQVAD